MNQLILIDDDIKLAGLLQEYLKRFEYELDHAPEPDQGIEMVLAGGYELVILDVMMPGKDGFTVCRELRSKSKIPIIMLTARGDLTDRVVGLEMGADDYLAKPFEPRELAARIQSVLRRSEGRGETGIRRFGQLEIRLSERSAFLDGKRLELTSMEWELLRMFTAQPGKKFSRDEILKILQGMEVEIFSRSIDILVSRLRQKLEDSPKEPRYIHTVRGTGYVFTG